MHYYDVFPRVVPSGRTATVRIRPRFGHAAFPPAERLNIYSVPVDGQYPDGTHRNFAWSDSCRQTLEWHLEDGELVVSGVFAGEQEHIITAEMTSENNPQQKKAADFRIYSLQDDLLALRPYKGDFHLHTNRSDGRECPAYVAARYRQRGFDFLAISDHGQYAPSLEAVNFWQPYGLDFQLFPGEEVHTPGNPVHIINFGATCSVNDLARADEEKYQSEVRAIQEKLPPLEPGLDTFPVAASEWVFDRIRENGGLAVFCHPYWYVTQYVISAALSSAIFQRRRFDAFELIGGFYKHQSRSNNYQVASWVHEQTQGNRFPVVGLSDSHGTTNFESGCDRTFTCGVDRDLFDWNFTLVLASENSVPALAGAIRDYRSVAVNRNGGERPHLYGEFRIVKYADFLLREYFPILTELCSTEGALMLDLLAGDPEAATALQAIKGRSRAFREASFPAF